VLLSNPIETESTSWSLRVDEISGNAGVYVGVGSRDLSLTSDSVDLTALWSMRLGCGKRYGNNSTSAYGEKFSKGDIVTVKVEVEDDKASIAFGRNGTCFGVAFENIPLPVYPALSLCCSAQVTYLN
jgi:hypothetical protein